MIEQNRLLSFLVFAAPQLQQLPPFRHHQLPFQLLGEFYCIFYTYYSL